MSLATQLHPPSLLQAPTKTAPRGHPGGEMATHSSSSNPTSLLIALKLALIVMSFTLPALLILGGRGGRFCPQKRSHHYHHRPSLWLNTRSSTKMPMAKGSNLRSVVCKIHSEYQNLCKVCCEVKFPLKQINQCYNGMLGWVSYDLFLRPLASSVARFPSPSWGH